MQNPISYLSKVDDDTMYYHQAMHQPDAQEFIKTVVKEIVDHCTRKYWEIVERKTVPNHCDILPSVWSMKRKRDLITRKPVKYKARLNIHGGKQEYGVNFYDTFLNAQYAQLFDPDHITVPPGGGAIDTRK